MIHHYRHIAALLIVAGALSACQQEEPTLFSSDSNGFYFDYDAVEDLNKSINFADSILAPNPDLLSVPVKIKLLGRFSSDPTPIKLEAKPVEGYDMPEVTIPEVYMEPDSYEKTVMIRIARPEVRDKEYAASITFNGTTGIEGFEAFQINVSESYTKPASWDYMGQMYYGDWSEDKYIFIAKVLNDTKFYDNYGTLYSNEGNPKVVSAIRAYHQEHPDEPVIAVPIVSDGSLTYEKPYYWGEAQDKYLGTYSSSAFQSLCSAQGITTANEEEMLSGDETKMKEMNKIAVTAMMNKYNSCYPYDWQGSKDDFRSEMWVPMLADVDYDIVTPVWWEDESIRNIDGTLTIKQMIEQYYGEYSEEKYKFMIRTCIEEYGTDNFVLAELFPIKAEWGETEQYATWWYAGKDGENGEQIITRLHNLFKEKSAGTGIEFP